MKKLSIALFACSMIIAFTVASTSPNEFKQLLSLEGTWIMKTKHGAIGEAWIKVSNSKLQNRGFYLKNADTMVTETVVLEERPEGIFYTSTVMDQNDRKPVAFKLSSFENNVFIFENASHDFPKRIAYHFVKADSIHAYIDGGKDNTGKRQDFYYRKVR